MAAIVPATVPATATLPATEVLNKPRHYFICFDYEGPAGGYLYCKSIKNKLDVVRGVSNGVDYVRKSLTIKDSERVFHETYLGNDAAFFLQNPLYPTDYFADCISWVNHTTYLDRENGVREYSFCTTAYNGGDVSDVMSQCWAKWKEVPEWFIWHVVRKMARAIAWLLLGYRDNRPLPVRWDPMMQRDLASNNIFVQWNSLTEEVPQLLLGDFGRAARLSDPVYPASLQEDCIYARDDYDYVVPPAEKVRRHIRGIHEDIQGLGYLLLDMISTAVTYMGDNESYSIEDIIEDLSGEHDEVDAGNFSPLAPFSQELKDLIAHIFIDWNEVPDANYPDGHYLINHVIPTADRMFAQWQHQIPTRSIKTMRRPSAAKVAVAQIPHDLFGDPREGDVAKSMNTILAKGWTLLKVGIDIVDLRQPLWVTNFDMGDKYRGEWLIAANDTPAEELEPTMPNGTPVRVLESQVLRGWIRYLTEHAGEPEPRWLTHKDFPGDLRKLVHAFHLTYPDKSRGRQFCITALA